MSILTPFKSLVVSLLFLIQLLLNLIHFPDKLV